MWILKHKNHVHNCLLALTRHTANGQEIGIYLIHCCPPTEKDAVVNPYFFWLNTGVRLQITIVPSVLWIFRTSLIKCPTFILLRNLKHTYGMSINACNFIIRYLRNRNHRVKIMGRYSDWVTINRGVPRGSILGALLFYIFTNDLFYIDMKIKIAHYADENNSHRVTHSPTLRKYNTHLVIFFENIHFQWFIR